MIIKGPHKNLNLKNAQKLINNHKIWLDVAEFINDKTSVYTAFNNNNKTLKGFAIIKPIQNTKNLKIELIVTKPKQGFGTALIQKIKNNAKIKYAKLKLVSLPKAETFYYKQNFKKYGDREFLFKL